MESLMTMEENTINSRYKGFDLLAWKLAEDDEKRFPYNKKKEKYAKRDRYKTHLIDMISMFESQFGQKEYIEAWEELKAYLEGKCAQDIMEYMIKIECRKGIGETKDSCKE